MERLAAGLAAAIGEIVFAALLAILAGALYWKAASAGIWVTALSFIGIFLLASSKMRLRAIDLCVALILVYELASLAFSHYAANGVLVLGSVAISVAVFFTVRLTMRSPLQMACLSGVLGLGGAALSFAGMRQFGANVERLSGVGLTNLIAFRSSLITPPAPWVAGEWFTALLLALPFAFALPAYLWWTKRRWGAAAALLTPALILATSTLSLSRAVFWSAVVFLFAGCALMAWSRIVTVRKGAALLVCMLGALVLILAVESAFFPGLFKAYAAQQTSQVRSSEGRIATWQRSLGVLRAHPLYGVGSSNAPLALLSSADENETTGFASRTFSLPVQVLVEKGIVGLALYSAFLVLLVREFLLGMPYPWRGVAQAGSGHSKTIAERPRPEFSGVSPTRQSARDAMNCCFAAGLVAVLARELVYSSLLEHTLTLALMAMLSAHLVRPDPT
jgi:O-antigen ligase